MVFTVQHLSFLAIFGLTYAFSHAILLWKTVFSLNWKEMNKIHVNFSLRQAFVFSHLFEVLKTHCCKLWHMWYIKTVISLIVSYNYAVILLHSSWTWYLYFDERNRINSGVHAKTMYASSSSCTCGSRVHS